MTLAIPPQVNEEQTKEKVYRYFPIKQEITLRIKTGSRDVYTMAYVEASEFNQFAIVENVEISLLCANPYFMDTLEYEIELNAASAIPLFSFPFSNESLSEDQTEFGQINTEPGTGLIVYDGGVETGVDIEVYLHGSVSQVDIYNGGLNQRLGFTTASALAYHGAPSVEGDKIVINTRVGEKSIFYVRDDDWYNMINSVWFTDVWLTLAPGSNYIVLDPAEGIELASATIRYRGLREGV
jgi:hypothetical protein